MKKQLIKNCVHDSYGLTFIFNLDVEFSYKFLTYLKYKNRNNFLVYFGEFVSKFPRDITGQNKMLGIRILDYITNKIFQYKK